MHISPISPSRDDVSELLKQATDHAISLYPDESNHLDDTTELSKSNVYFIGAFLKEVLIGIGAVKTLLDDQEYGEMKRVFVLPDYRSKGASKLILKELESYLLKSGISLSRLETGIHQPEAIGLYKQLGYRECAPFGAYKPDPLSLFMEKKLRA